MHPPLHARFSLTIYFSCLCDLCKQTEIISKLFHYSIRTSQIVTCTLDSFTLSNRVLKSSPKGFVGLMRQASGLSSNSSLSPCFLSSEKFMVIRLTQDRHVFFSDGITTPTKAIDLWVCHSTRITSLQLKNFPFCSRENQLYLFVGLLVRNCKSLDTEARLWRQITLH